MYLPVLRLCVGGSGDDLRGIGVGSEGILLSSSAYSISTLLKGRVYIGVAHSLDSIIHYPAGCYLVSKVADSYYCSHVTECCEMTAGCPSLSNIANEGGRLENV
jgi:hypothetical protein